MLERLDMYKQVSNKPAQPHQQQSIIVRKSVEYFELLFPALPDLIDKSLVVY
jgi:hypothetical protein